MKVNKTEERFREFVRLRKDGYLNIEIAEILGVSAVTISRYSSRLKSNDLFKAAKNLEKRLVSLTADETAKPDEIMTLLDTLAKIKAIQTKSL